MRDGNSPQLKASCSPVHHVSVDERQHSSGLSGFAIATGHGQCKSGMVKQLLSLSLCSSKEPWGHSLDTVFSPAYELEFLFYFFPKRLLILEGVKFHTLHFRLLCISSIRQSLVKCCFIFLCVFLAVVKGQAIFCLRISKWISQCISACSHMADKTHQYSSSAD